MIQTSNIVVHCCCHTPLTARSAARLSVDWVGDGSWRVGSLTTFFQANKESSQNKSHISLCLIVTRPPFLQSKAWDVMNIAQQPSQMGDRSFKIICRSYIRGHILEANCVPEFASTKVEIVPLSRKAVSQMDKVFFDLIGWLSSASIWLKRPITELNRLLSCSFLTMICSCPTCRTLRSWY